MTPLTNSQKKLVEDNHNLIFAFLHLRGLPLDSTEDWYGVAAIGMCQAAKAYDESRGVKFSTLAFKAMDNEVKRTCRDNSKEVLPSVSLDECVLEDPYLTLGNIVPDPKESFSSIDLGQAIDEAYNELTDTQRKIIDLLLYREFTQQQAATEANVSVSRVSKIYRNFVDSVNSHCAG